MNSIGTLPSLDRYYCCNKPLSIIDIGIECWSNEIRVYPIFCCFECHMCYDNKYDTGQSQLMTRPKKYINDCDLQRIVFNTLDSQSINQIAGAMENLLCENTTFSIQLEEKLANYLGEIETKLCEMIEKKHKDILGDLRYQVNHFQLC